VLISDQTILFRAIALQEAKQSFEIENFVPTNDELRFWVSSGSVHVVLD